MEEGQEQQERQGLPVIDLKREGHEEKLREASEEWGGFRLINHGVATELMAEMKRVARELLDLPVEMKQRNKHVLAGSGYIAPNPRNPIFEAMGLFDAGNPNDVSSFCDLLQLSSHQRDTIMKYAEAMHGLAVDLANKLAKSMGLSDYSFKGWPSQLRTNKYAITEDKIGSSGVTLHSDPGFVTVLQEDEDIGGLEVMNPFGELIPVVPQSGTLVVNLGDMATIWSNGRIRSLEHRVQCESAGSRISIPLFLSPPADKTVETPAEFIDDEHPRLYSSITYDEFR